jgi:thiosulfate reductase cytochrome b subunit
MAEVLVNETAIVKKPRHTAWVRITHWTITISFLLLAYTGFLILMVHPRLYWGEVGNDLTPALIELPISRNYKHNGWENQTPFFNTSGSAVTASRTYDIFNKNGMARSLHFLSGWVLVATGLLYVVFGMVTGHFRRKMLPDKQELGFRVIWSDVVYHARMHFPKFQVDSRYGLLQRYSYLTVIFILLPLLVATGLTMSPAVVAAYPFLLKIFFGTQSARTIHFFASVMIELFLIVHVFMIIKTGMKEHMRAMTIGK